LLEYYLKFFEDGTTRAAFRESTHRYGFAWANSIFWRLAKKNWIQQDGNRWFITAEGIRIYCKYLGVK